MRDPIRWLAVATFVLVSAPVVARADDVPAIPVRDLPPFPDVEEDVDTVSEVGVYGASLAEEETVVGAAKREQSLGTVASAVTVLTADTIRRFGYRSLAEAVRSVSGAYVTDDRMIERIGVRGVQLLGDANTRILVLIDGTPLNEPWSQFVDGSTALPVSLDDVARIEVIRGPVSSIYGTNAFVGIINIVTIEADKAPKAYGRTSIDSYGTVGANAAFNTGDINRQVRGTVSYNYRLGEDVNYSDLAPTGMPSTSTSADGAHSLFGSLALNYGRVFAQVRGYDRQRELPGAPYDATFGSEDNLNNDRHVLGEVGYTREVSKKVTVAARVYGNYYAFRSHLALSGMDYETNAHSMWFGGEVRALADILKKDNRNLFAVTAGANFEATQTSSTATTKPLAIEKNFSIAGVYVEGTTEPLPWLAATAGARFDQNTEFSSKLSPRAALFLRKGEDFGVKLLYAQGFRNPSIYEAYYDDDERFAPGLDADDKTILSPETIEATEVVAYGKLAAGIKLRLSLWDWRLENLIIRDRVNDPEAMEVRFRYQNSSKLVSRGAEIESSYRDVEGRYVFANAAFSIIGDNCLGDDGLGDPLLSDANCNESQNAPELIAKLGGSSQLLFEKFYLSTELHYLSERGTQDPDVKAPAYLGWNLVAYAPNIRGFDITFGARNLLGREVVPAQSDYNRSTPSELQVLRVPGPGREVFARVGYRF